MTKSTFTIENQTKICSNCSNKLIKYGKTKNGNQRYKCKSCQKTSVEIYHYNAYLSTINSNIIQLTKEGLGIRSTARYLQISTTTLLKRLLQIASKIVPPKLTIEDRKFQVDELRTFHKKRLKPLFGSPIRFHSELGKFMLFMLVIEQLKFLKSYYFLSFKQNQKLFILISSIHIVQ